MPDEIKKGAPECGLYFVLPDDWVSPDFLQNLKHIYKGLNASNYEKNTSVVELRVKDNVDEEAIDLVQTLSATTKSQGIVFLIGNDVSLADVCDADGVILDDATQIENARDILGDDAIIGLRCGTSRRLADQGFDLGVDFVSFFDVNNGHIDPSIVRWWRVKTDIPCLVEGKITKDDCAFYVDAGAEFIECSNYILNHPDGVLHGITAMADAIEQAGDVDAPSVKMGIN